MFNASLNKKSLLHPPNPHASDYGVAKKKRCVILDHGIQQPMEANPQYATSNLHIKIQNGAGKEASKIPECPKVGAPACIYDSKLEQPDSLYLQTRLCQNNLNNKCWPKWKHPNSKMTINNMNGDFQSIYAIGPCHKKFWYKNGSIVELVSYTTTIVDWTIEGTTWPYGEGSRFQEIGINLVAQSCEAVA